MWLLSAGLLANVGSLGGGFWFFLVGCFFGLVVIVFFLFFIASFMGGRARAVAA